jgi:hypothetical protein
MIFVYVVLMISLCRKKKLQIVRYDVLCFLMIEFMICLMTKIMISGPLGLGRVRFSKSFIKKHFRKIKIRIKIKNIFKKKNIKIMV